VADLKVESVWFNVYLGGAGTAPYAQHLYIDEVRISEQPLLPAASVTVETAAALAPLEMAGLAAMTTQISLVNTVVLPMESAAPNGATDTDGLTARLSASWVSGEWDPLVDGSSQEFTARLPSDGAIERDLSSEEDALAQQVLELDAMFAGISTELRPFTWI
jgi:hypothetical protein